MTKPDSPIAWAEEAAKLEQEYPDTCHDMPAFVAAKALLACVEALENAQQACLIAESDGIIVTEDPHIPLELFDKICAALKLAKGEDQP